MSKSSSRRPKNSARVRSASGLRRGRLGGRDLAGEILDTPSREAGLDESVHAELHGGSIVLAQERVAYGAKVKGCQRFIGSS
jgi:hypothetical protein